MTDNSPTGTLIEAPFGAAYKAHNYRWPVVGWMKDLDAINLKDCQDFFNTHYNPKNVTVLIVGAIDRETAFAGRVPLGRGSTASLGADAAG